MPDKFPGLDFYQISDHYGIEATLTMQYPIRPMIVLGWIGYDVLFIVLIIVYSIRDKKLNAKTD